MAVKRGCRTTPSGTEVIEREIKSILQKYSQRQDPDEFEETIKKSFRKVQDAVSDDTIMAVDGWICEFCDEIFTGRTWEEAGVVECERCSNIVCDSCAETFIEKRKGCHICRDCC